VLREKRSYILDMRTAQATPTTPPTKASAEAEPADAIRRMLAGYVSQPPLDFFHRRPVLKAAAESESESPADGAPPNVPVIN
jgi:hypothetical protein